MLEDGSTKSSASTSLPKGEEGRSHGMMSLIRHGHVTTQPTNFVYFMIKSINGVSKFFLVHVLFV